MGVSFVTVYKMAESVAQQMRNCVCITQTATTGTRPPVVFLCIIRLNFLRHVTTSLVLNNWTLLILENSLILSVDEG